MSCVIGLVTSGNIVMGADAAASDGNVLIPNHLKKISVHEVNIWTSDNEHIEFVVGACGTTQMSAIVRHFLELPRLENPDDLDGYMETNFLMSLHGAIQAAGYMRIDRDPDGFPGVDELLVGVLGRLYFIGHDFSIASSMRGYDAIGSGREIALGSLFTTGKMVGHRPDGRERVLAALDAASELATAVSGPYQLYEAEGLRYE
jgi:hypothetical protein